jgi:ABC-type Fe3+-hydroxamate transport system substrate-binding protein
MSRRLPLLVLLLAIACGESPNPAVTDGLGRSVVLPKRVDRVVTLAPNLTEIVYAMGAGEKIVGTDDYSNFPEAARSLTKVGGMQPNVEKIAALKPDLVLASSEGNHPSLAPALAAAGIPLYVVRTDRLSEVAPAMTLVGEILDASNTKKAVRELERDIAAERRTRANKRRVMFAVWVDPLYVGGRETFTDDLLTLAGAENAVRVTGWPQYSLESLLASPPDLILYPRGAVTPQQIAALQKRVPELRAPIVPVNEDIFQRPGPRMAQAAHALNAILDQGTMNDER